MKNDTVEHYFPLLADIEQAAERIAQVADSTPLQQSARYSQALGADVFLKREDLQRIRSYKIRGAFNKIASLPRAALMAGVVCASAGNHAQGVAFACRHQKVKGTIYMPVVTPRQKVDQTKMFGGDWVEVVLEGDTFDDSNRAARAHCQARGMTFVPPFDDPKIIEGQATVGLEIVRESEAPIDYLFVPVGGGGLISGLCAVFHSLSPSTKIIGVEPLGAASMKASLEAGHLVRLGEIDKFVDGAAVQQVGQISLDICRDHLYKMVAVPEGRVCQVILDLYNRDAIVAEPAGALTLAALEDFAPELRGKRVVCVVSGGNNDITRMAEIKERAQFHANLKHYFIVRFPQRPGALKEFVVDILGPNDDITHFEYSKKSSREQGPAVVGIELKTPDDLQPLVQRMKANGFFGDYLNDKPDLFQYLV